MTGEEADLRSVTDPAAAAASRVAHGAELLAFTDALVGEHESLDRARSALLEAAGAENVVDAAAVASNFQRMVRIADATGIPLDAPLEQASGDVRAELGLDRFAALHAG